MKLLRILVAALVLWFILFVPGAEKESEPPDVYMAVPTLIVAGIVITAQLLYTFANDTILLITSPLLYLLRKSQEQDLQDGNTYFGDTIRDTTSNETPIPLAVGSVRLGANKVRMSEPGKTKRVFDLTVCQGEIESFDQTWVNDILWEDLKGNATNDAHTKIEYLGTKYQQADFRFDATTEQAESYRGIAYVAARVKATPQMGGDPTFVFQIKGKKIPTLAALSVDAFTNTPAVILRYIISELEGKSDAEIDTAEFQVLETYCDTVPTDGTEARYQFDYVFDVRSSLNDMKKLLWESFNGRTIWSQGKIKPVWERDLNYGTGTATAVTVGKEKYEFTDGALAGVHSDNHFIGYVLKWTSGNNANEQAEILEYVGASGLITCAVGAFTADIVVTDAYELVACYTFTLDNIVRGTFGFAQQTTPNIVRVHYINGERDWKKDSVEIRDEDLIDRHGEILDERNLWYITRPEVARRRAQFIFDKGRVMDYLTEFTGFTSAAKLEVFDVVAVSHVTPGWTLKRFLVREKFQDSLGRPRVSLEAYDSNIYHDREATKQTGYYPDVVSQFEPTSIEDITLTEDFEIQSGYYYPIVRITFTLPAGNDYRFWAYAEIWVATDRDGVPTDADYIMRETSSDGTTGAVISGLQAEFEGGDTVYVKILSVNVNGAKEELEDVDATTITLVAYAPITPPTFTAGCWTTAVIGAGDSSITVTNTNDFPASGTARIHDPAGIDEFTFSGKTATTFTGIPGGGDDAVTAHTTIGLPVTPANTKHIEIMSSDGELHFYGDRGDTTIEEIATIGIKTSGGDKVIGSFGSGDTSHIAIQAESSSADAIVGTSSTNNGVAGITNGLVAGKSGVIGISNLDGYGVTGFISDEADVSAVRGWIGSATLPDLVNGSCFVAQHSGAGDATFDFWLSIPNVRWRMGIDNSVAGDPFVLSTDHDLANAVLTVTTAGAFTLGGDVSITGNLGVGIAIPETRLHVAEGTFADIPMFERTGANTNAIWASGKIRSTHTGNMGDDFGTGLFFYIQDDAATENVIASISATREGADDSGKLELQTVSAGARSTKVTILPGGNVGILTADPRTLLDVNGIATIEDTLILSKTSGKGIKVDTTTPTFGWRDLLGDVFARNTGASKPTFAVYQDTLREFQFAAGDEEYFKFHIPHDYVAGTDVFLHIHWSHTGALVTGGTITFEVETTYAKGHNQAAFHGSADGTFVGTASTTQYQHIISEVQLSDPTPVGLEIETGDLEPDGVIIMRILLDANAITVSGGGVPDPFIHFVDIHYQSTNIGTKDKVPDFYS
jgi:hypothetical protein